MDGEYMLVKTSGMDALNTRFDAMLEQLNSLSGRLDALCERVQMTKSEVGDLSQGVRDTKGEARDTKGKVVALNTDIKKSPEKTHTDAEAKQGKESRQPLVTRHRMRSVISSRPVYNMEVDMPRHFKAVRQKKKELPTYHQMSESFSVAPSEETPEEAAEEEEFIVKKVE